ncbi:carbohydrate ABC transporter permease [Streptomyces clavuligerus]|uniref:carbohydrate ABC transporter permease n=1 Tax=Streptomyces clavuligerus TaxID=1901 RepID=UPI00081091AA|nr:carbohydrate ABC transporter permease [Streptomyces clavuligerus]ANW17090.1 sugar ABC transporter permease [Streptomyces clavuligerus]AXU11629.1 carbohydrate ABC transporter permease [Streptomyces clavuligerus]MBY6301463.1 carbohydrate ABC transporter permease [Streptomyces clavuligerus]QPL61750.1 carbohydrate ABC transporter permease [Streptomyces clavuligerus]QPL67783.1 carbohydrate ABC transporter permease [Streptomyces clavuligerus]
MNGAPASSPRRARPASRLRAGGRRSLRADGLGLLFCAVMAFPLYWMVLTAIRPASEIRSNPPRFWTLDPTLDHVRRALDSETFWSSVRASALVGAGTVVVSVLIGVLAAYAVARFSFAGRRAFVLVILSVQMIPLAGLIIPLYLLLSDAGLTDSLTGVVLTYLVFMLPFTVWLLRGFVAGIPVELEEAAMVDGCTRAGAFRRVTLPLLAPGLVATSIYSLVQAWNEYVLAYVLLSSNDKQTVSIWLVSFQTSFGTDYGALMAGATLTALPVVVFFMIVQRRVAAGLAAGAVKG